MRVRVTVTFAAGGLVLSATLALLTYEFSDRYLTEQRERTATRQAYLFARTVRDEIRRGASDDFALAVLEVSSDSSVLLHRGARWYSSGVGTTRADLPRSLREVVAIGEPARQRIEIDSDPVMVIGVPLAEVRAEFFQVVPLTELANTLGVLQMALLVAAAVTTIAAALLGVWAGRRVMRPLKGVGAAAREIAAGDLGARLEVGQDPDLVELAESFNHMVGVLRARVERDARFASDVSHELRSPLTTLTSAVSVLERRQGEFSPRAREAIDLLSAEIRRFERLLKELLELARAESETEHPELEAVRIGDLVEHAVRVNGNDRVVVDLDAALVEHPVMADKRRLDRVLANLLQNARAYGGGAIRVGIKTADPILRIEVDDEGPGVPQDQREMVFDRFFRGSAAGRRGDAGGTGLGLSLVAEHVRVLGGRVWVEDRPEGPGARFVVEIPRVPV